MCCSPAHWRRKPPIRTRLTWRFFAAAAERHAIAGVACGHASLVHTGLMQRTGGRKPWSKQNGKRFRVMKGAVRTIAQACGLQPAAIESLEARVSASALKGYRTLAVARGPETGTPLLVGLVTLYDPPRPDAKQLIATLHDLASR